LRAFGGGERLANADDRARPGRASARDHVLAIVVERRVREMRVAVDEEGGHRPGVSGPRPAPWGERATDPHAARVACPSPSLRRPPAATSVRSGAAAAPPRKWS